MAYSEDLNSEYSPNREILRDRMQVTGLKGIAMEDRENWYKICPSCFEYLRLGDVGAKCECGETAVREGDDRQDNSSGSWNSRAVGPMG